MFIAQAIYLNCAPEERHVLHNMGLLRSPSFALI